MGGMGRFWRRVAGGFCRSSSFFFNTLLFSFLQQQTLKSSLTNHVLERPIERSRLKHESHVSWRQSGQASLRSLVLETQSRQ